MTTKIIRGKVIYNNYGLMLRSE